MPCQGSILTNETGKTFDVRHVLTVINNLPITGAKLKEMREATRNDSLLSRVILVTKEGWPEEKHHCPKEIAEFWIHRCKLSALDGLVFKGEKLVVPRVMRPEMLRRIHTGHLRIEKCKKRARDVLFWPGMNAQIQELVSKCVICLESTAANQKEPLISRRITSRPLFVINGEDYVPLGR